MSQLLQDIRFAFRQLHTTVFVTNRIASSMAASFLGRSLNAARAAFIEPMQALRAEQHIFSRGE